MQQRAINPASARRTYFQSKSPSPVKSQFQSKSQLKVSLSPLLLLGFPLVSVFVELSLKTLSKVTELVSVESEPDVVPERSTCTQASNVPFSSQESCRTRFFNKFRKCWVGVRPVLFLIADSLF